MTQNEDLENISTLHKRALLQLLLRMSVYYLVVSIIIAAALQLIPSLNDDLPIGGVSSYNLAQDNAVYQLEDALLNGDGDAVEEYSQGITAAETLNGPEWFRNAKSLFFAMLTTLILMIPVSWVYKTIHEGSVYDHSIDETALVLPAVVAGIVTLVQHSLALAFSLAGIVAGVRFRRALSDTFDTLFIFVAIGVGIAAGVNSVEIAIVITVFFNYVTIFMCIFGDGLESQFLARKKILRDHKRSTQIISQPDKPTE